MTKEDYRSKTIQSLDYRTFKLVNPDLNTLNDEEIEAKLENSYLLEIANGQCKFHPDYQPFNESEYLNTVPDIREQVESGTFRSGFEHFCKSGYKEIFSGERDWKIISKHEKTVFKARIDGNASNQIWGWAVDQNDLNHKLVLEVFVDQIKIGETVADIYRDFLEKDLKSDGKHAFQISFDPKLRKTKLGIVSLKEKEHGKTLPSNRYSIKYDFQYIFGSNTKQIMQKSSMDVLKDIMDEYQIALEHYEKQHFDIAQQMMEKLLKDKKTFPEVFYLHLLTIYLASADVPAVSQLYMDAMIIGLSIEVEDKVHALILDYCSDLWLTEPKEYISGESIHNLELLFFILKNLDSNKYYLFTQSTDVDNLILHIIESAFLIDRETIEKLFQVITKNQYSDALSKKGLELYIENLPQLEKLVKAIHQVDLIVLPELIVWMEQLLQTKNDHAIIKSIAKQFLAYLDVLINSKQVDRIDAETLLKLLQRRFTYLLKNDLHLQVLIIDLFYLLDRKQSASNMLDELFTVHYNYLDRHCRYLSEILFFSFQSTRTKEEPSVLSLLKVRLEEERTNYTDNIILLTNIYRNKHAIDVDILYKVIQNLSRFRAPKLSTEMTQNVEEMLHTLVYGTVDQYLLNSKEIYAYKAGNASSDFQFNFHNNRLFDFQNLHYLSILNDKPAVKEICFSPETRYLGLLDKKKRKEIKTTEQTLGKHQKTAVFTSINRLNEDQYFHYYKSMLYHAKSNLFDIYLCSESVCHHLYWQENDKLQTERIENYRQFTDTLMKQTYGRYVILSSDSVVHHDLAKTIDMENEVMYLSSEEEVYSFSISHRLFDFITSMPTSSPIQNIQDFLLVQHKNLMAYMQMNKTVFKQGQQGLISFENISKGMNERLMNDSYPLLELDDTVKSLKYLTSLYSDSRIEKLVSINVSDIALTLLRPSTVESESLENDIACILVQRNEYTRLEGFLEYYRTLGVNKFYIVDNASDDNKTLDFLLDQDDVELYSTTQAYSQSKYGVKWAEAIIQSKRVGKWTLLLDADELLVLDSRFDTLPALCTYLDESGHDALHTTFVDMYSKDPIGKTPYMKGKEILDHCTYHDKRFYTFFDTNGGIKRDMNTYAGGVRSRVFGLETVILNKVPLFKYDTGHKIREGIHWIDQSNPAYAKAVLLHFKYIETFHGYVEEESRRGQHWDGASEYRQYHDFLEKNPDFSLYHPVLSTKFTTVEDFYENMFSPFTLKEEMKNV